jgi:tetratricopeptide (TPR) repeat protein
LEINEQILSSKVARISQEIASVMKIRQKMEGIRSQAQKLFSDQLLLKQLEKEYIQKIAELTAEIPELNKKIDLSDKPSDFESYFADTAELMFEAGKTAECLDILEKAAEKLPYSVKILFLLGNVLFGAGKVFQAGKIFKRLAVLAEAGPLNSENPDLAADQISYLLFRTSYELSDYRSFDYYYQKIRNPEPYRFIYENMKRQQQAYLAVLTYLEKQEKEGNSSGLLYLRLGREYIRALKYPQALAAYLKGTNLSEPATEILPEIYNDLIKNGKKLALKDSFISGLVSGTPESAGLFYSLGRYYLERGRPEKAAVALQRALDLAGNFEPYFNEQVIADLSKAKAGAELSAEVFLTARQYYQENDFKRAVELFQEVIDEGRLNNYQNYVIYDYLALLYERQDLHKQAEQAINNALSGFQDDELAARAATNAEFFYWKIIKNMPDWMDMVQINEEWIEVLKEITALKPQVVLEIGTYKGGTIFSISRVAGNDALIITIDMPGGGFGGVLVPEENFSRLQQAVKEHGPEQQFYYLREDSHKIETLERVKEILDGKSIDVLFIDGDHAYEGVKKDFQMYSPLVSGNGMIIFHDILENKFNEAEISGLVGNFTNLDEEQKKTMAYKIQTAFLFPAEVDKFWREIAPQYPNREIIFHPQQKGFGIGIIYNRI